MKERTFGNRICVWCGQEFIAKSPKANSCGADHYRPCAICGEPLLVKESYQNYIKYGPRTCPTCRKLKISMSKKSVSREDKQRINDKRRTTMISKYGVDNPLKVPEIKDKVKATVKDRYGVDNLSQSEDIQNKIKQNSIERFGVDHYSKDRTIREHMINGMIDKYGVPYAMQNEEIRKKASETNLRKYGHECVLSDENVQAKIKQTCLEKYGVEYAASADSVVAKRTVTNYKKYGGPAYIFSPDYLRTTVKDESKYSEYLKFKEDPKSYILGNFSQAPTYQQLQKLLGVCDTTIGYHICRLNLQYLIRYNNSSMEDEMYELLLKYIPSDRIVRHSRSIISPYELDFYIPDYRLGIECNPTATHNSDISYIFEGNVLNKLYHKNKTDKAEASMIRLIHVFGYDWAVRRDIIASMIKNALNATEDKVYARNLTLKEVSDSEARLFLNINHLKGYTNSAVRYGLFQKDTMLSIMTFGKMRKLNGGLCDDNTYELSRFCSKIDTSVVGGASKLFKHFVSTIEPNKVVSFSDRATTSGKLYSKLGFRSVSISDPGYVWADPNTEEFFKRTSCQKSNLRNLFKDNTIDIENNTEAKIMIDHGYGRVYDSGLIRWEWNFTS